MLFATLCAVGIVMHQHHAYPPIRPQKDDTAGFKRSPDLIARALMHLAPTFGLEALERGQ